MLKECIALGLTVLAIAVCIATTTVNLQSTLCFSAKINLAGAFIGPRLYFISRPFRLKQPYLLSIVQTPVVLVRFRKSAGFPGAAPPPMLRSHAVEFLCRNLFSCPYSPSHDFYSFFKVLAAKATYHGRAFAVVFRAAAGALVVLFPLVVSPDSKDPQQAP